MNSKTTSANRIESHPYGPFIPRGAKALILGTFPAWEFSHPDRSSIRREVMVDFAYGRIRGPNANLLWRLLGEIHGRSLTSVKAIRDFLRSEKIALADVYSKVVRKRTRSSSDQDLIVVEYNEKLIEILDRTPTIRFVFCTSRNVQRIFERYFAPKLNRTDLKIILLISPSASANRAIGSHPEFKKHFVGLDGDRTYAYRLAQYRKYFPLK